MSSSPSSSEPVLPQADDPHGLIAAMETEFRSQIEGLLAMADRLSRQPLTADAMSQVRSIRAAGETLGRLTNDARDLILARKGGIVLEPGPHSLRALMDAVLERWTAGAAEAGVAFLISYTGDPDLAVVVDAGRLAQVFDALIDNALRQTRQGSVEAVLHAHVEGETVRIDGLVRDTGNGAMGGSVSLPLSLTHAIVQAMGGKVQAEGNAGQGRTVSFHLTAPRAGAAAEPAHERPLRSAPHVLVVDDNATNRMVAEALCEMFDCTSETAEDGEEAVEAARRGRFDLILMDIKMPRMDGIAATQAIRALGGPAGEVPIVALTANVDPDDARTYLAAGMCCVVEKPIKPDRLLQAINLALASSTAANGEDARTAAA